MYTSKLNTPVLQLSLLHFIWCPVLVAFIPDSPVVQTALCVLFSTYSLNDTAARSSSLVLSIIFSVFILLSFIRRAPSS